ncbi:hypothetical protein AAZX31_02G076200 [Glycine max]
MNMKTSRPIFYILYQNPKASLAGLVIMLEYINFAFILYTVERLTSIGKIDECVVCCKSSGCLITLFGDLYSGL